MRPLLDRTAFYIVDLDDQGPSDYVAFFPEISFLPSRALAVDKIVTKDHGLEFYRKGTHVGSCHHHGEYFLLERRLVETLSREALYRLERIGEKSMDALVKEMYPDESRLAERKLEKMKRQLFGGNGDDDAPDGRPMPGTYL